MYKTLIFSFLLLTTRMVMAAPVERAERPNIVFLFADDQRADTIGVHGNPHIQTPNLDQLAADGFSFRRNYCAGSFSGAVCVASRAMLMTGRHWMNLPKSWQPKWIRDKYFDGRDNPNHGKARSAPAKPARTRSAK